MLYLAYLKYKEQAGNLNEKRTVMEKNERGKNYLKAWSNIHIKQHIKDLF